MLSFPEPKSKFLQDRGQYIFPINGQRVSSFSFVATQSLLQPLNL